MGAIVISIVKTCFNPLLHYHRPKSGFFPQQPHPRDTCVFFFSAFPLLVSRSIDFTSTHTPTPTRILLQDNGEYLRLQLKVLDFATEQKEFLD